MTNFNLPPGNLRNRRLSLRLTAEELASRLKVSIASVFRWERRDRISLKSLRAFEELEAILTLPAVEKRAGEPPSPPGDALPVVKKPRKNARVPHWSELTAKWDADDAGTAWARPNQPEERNDDNG